MRMWQRSWGRRTEYRETSREHFDYTPIPTHTRGSFHIHWSTFILCQSSGRSRTPVTADRQPYNHQSNRDIYDYNYFIRRLRHGSIRQRPLPLPAPHCLSHDSHTCLSGSSRIDQIPCNTYSLPLSTTSSAKRSLISTQVIVPHHVRTHTIGTPFSSYAFHVARSSLQLIR